MALIFREAHAAPEKKRINEEYFILENDGATAVSTARLQVISARAPRPGQKPERGSVLGMIDPGFMLQPGEKILVVSGVPGKKSHGEPPSREGMRTYHLFQHAGLLTGAGTVIKLAMNQIEVAKLVYDPNTESGVAAKPAAVAQS
ncbi:MAG: hypothetical protein ABIS92_12835 [Polyangia bacterium]